jgi:hypothetical protein
MINQLKIYNVGEKIRVGNVHDGGYVLPKQMLEESKCLFSYGISNDITFDENYIQLTNKKVYGYDHTIDSVHTNYPDLFTLYKKGISGTTQEDTANFLQHYKELNLSERALLKIDVEGCEYEWLANTNIEELSHVVTGMVIEFHDLDQEIYRDQFISYLIELDKYFYLCHVHGNNCGSIFNYEEYENVPKVIELTFVSKDLVTSAELNNETFPTELDSPNNCDLPDIDLYFIKRKTND